MSGRPRSLLTLLLVTLSASVLAAQSTRNAAGSGTGLTLSFAGADYFHRWSKQGQHEFTPAGQEDLAKWDTMLTLNVHDPVRTGDQLADLANGLVANYQRAGKILRTDSKPRTDSSEAEHFAAAILFDRNFLEVAFARVILHEGQGLIIVYSKRVYGTKAGNEMSAWLEKNGPDAERMIMSWSGLPTMARLKALQ